MKQIFNNILLKMLLKMLSMPTFFIKIFIMCQSPDNHVTSSHQLKKKFYNFGESYEILIFLI